MVPSVSYLGYKIDSEGLHPLPKVAAVQSAPVPKSVTELKSFLGLLSYYSKFLPNLSTTLSPLYVLLKSSTKWSWSRRHSEAFQTAKNLLTSSKPIGFASRTLSTAEKNYSQIPNRERGTLLCIWSEEVSLIPVWTPFHNVYRS